jgi:hypothetical protein
MAVKITSQIAPTQIKPIAKHIVNVSQTVKELTPRTPAAIKHALETGCMIIAKDGNKTIGWLMIEPLFGKVAELGFAYVNPPYRGKNVFIDMMKAAAKRDISYVAATYKPFILEIFKQQGFKQVSLAQVICVSHGKFVTKRLFNKAARQSVAYKTAQAKPLYLTRLVKK